MCSSVSSTYHWAQKTNFNNLRARKLTKADFLVRFPLPCFPAASPSWLAARQLCACWRQWPRRKLTRDLSGSCSPPAFPACLLSLPVSVIDNEIFSPPRILFRLIFSSACTSALISSAIIPARWHPATMAKVLCRKCEGEMAEWRTRTQSAAARQSMQ